MNPTTINNKNEAAETKNQSETRQAQSAVPLTSNQNATPVCQNGVCMVTWKPAKPQAA